MKDAFWFPHDSNARNDARLLELRAELGWEGYGLWWALIEQLREATDYRLSNDKKGGLAMGLGIPKKQLEDLLTLCFDLGLIGLEDGYFFAPALRRRMEPWDTKRAALAEAGKRGAANRWAGQKPADSPANTTPEPPQGPADSHPNGHPIATPLAGPMAIREEENNITEEEKKEPLLSVEDAASAAAPAQVEELNDIDVVQSVPESPTPGLRTPGGPADVGTRKKHGKRGMEPPGFESFWLAYPRKEKRPAASVAFGRLKAEEQAAAIVGVKAWFARRTDWVGPKGDFRPHPATWLNEKRWLELANPIPHLSNPQQNAVYSNQSSATSAAARLHTPAPDASAGWGYPGS